MLFNLLSRKSVILTRVLFRDRLSKMSVKAVVLSNHFSNKSEERRDNQYVFKEVRNNSIIKDFSYGLINPQLLKIPDSQQTDTDLKAILAQLNSLPSDIEMENCLKQFKKMGLFGTMIPRKYGGIGLSLSHHAYLMQNERIFDWVLNLIAHQNLCANAILHYGSEEQKNKYLPRLASGETVGAFCLTENSSGSDMFAMETVGVLNALEDHYVVDGTKNWVVNGAIADVMVVFVITQDSRFEGGRNHLTALVIEREMEGVSVTKQYNIPSIPNSHLADVTFKSVFVPVENVLFEDHGGYKIANYIQNNARCMIGSYVAGWSRFLVKDLLDRERTSSFTNDSHLRDLLNDCISYLYAIESTVFFTTRFADQYEIVEIELESAAVKVFSIESAQKMMDNYVQIIDLLGDQVSPRISKLFEQVKYLQSFLGSNYFVRLYIGGTMSQLSEHTFLEIKERLKTPVENFSWLMEEAKNIDKNINWTEKIKDSRYSGIVDKTVFLTELESMYKKLQISRIKLCKTSSRYKEGTLDRQYVIEAMSHIGILIYVISCCVARANTNFGDFEIACTKHMFDKARIVIDDNVAALTASAEHEDFSLLPLLAEDIRLAGGYPSVNIFELKSTNDDSQNNSFDTIKF